MRLTPQHIQTLNRGMRQLFKGAADYFCASFRVVAEEMLGRCTCPKGPCKHSRLAEIIEEEVKKAAMFGVATLAGMILPDPSHGETKE